MKLKPSQFKNKFLSVSALIHEAILNMKTNPSAQWTKRFNTSSVHLFELLANQVDAGALTKTLDKLGYIPKPSMSYSVGTEVRFVAPSAAWQQASEGPFYITDISQQSHGLEYGVNGAAWIRHFELVFVADATEVSLGVALSYASDDESEDDESEDDESEDDESEDDESEDDESEDE